MCSNFDVVSLMHVRHMVRWLVAAVGCVCAISLPAQNSAPASASGGGALPTAKEIMDHVVERARWVEQNRPALQYTYVQHTMIEKFDDDGGVKEREERLYRLERIEGEPFMRLVQKNGQPPTSKDLEDEKKREREFRKRLAERRARSKPDEESFRFDSDLISKYRAEVLGREVVNGRAAYVLRFEPKSDDLPVRKRIDRLTNKLAGKLWIDEKDHEIVKAEGRLVAPARVGWGLLANFQKLDFAFEQVRMDDATWLPLRLDARLEGRVVFSTLNQRQTIRWKDFQKTAASAPQKASATRH